MLLSSSIQHKTQCAEGFYGFSSLGFLVTHYCTHAWYQAQYYHDYVLTLLVTNQTDTTFCDHEPKEAEKLASLAPEESRSYMKQAC